jgi:hypothetical protein
MFAVWDNYSIRQSFKHNTQCSIIHEQCLMAMPIWFCFEQPHIASVTQTMSRGSDHCRITEAKTACEYTSLTFVRETYHAGS